MKYFEALDIFFPIPADQEVSQLEQAARLCMERASEAKSIQVAMIAQSCALDIRNLPGWSVLTRKTWMIFYYEKTMKYIKMIAMFISLEIIVIGFMLVGCEKKPIPPCDDVAFQSNDKLQQCPNPRHYMHIDGPTILCQCPQF